MKSWVLINYSFCDLTSYFIFDLLRINYLHSDIYNQTMITYLPCESKFTFFKYIYI